MEDQNGAALANFRANVQTSCPEAEGDLHLVDPETTGPHRRSRDSVFFKKQ